MCRAPIRARLTHLISLLKSCRQTLTSCRFADHRIVASTPARGSDVDAIIFQPSIILCLLSTVAVQYRCSEQRQRRQILPGGRITLDNSKVSKHQLYVIPFGTPPTRGPAVQVFPALGGVADLKRPSRTAGNLLLLHLGKSGRVSHAASCRQTVHAALLACLASLLASSFCSALSLKPFTLSSADLDFPTIDRRSLVFHSLLP